MGARLKKKTIIFSSFQNNIENENVDFYYINFSISTIIYNGSCQQLLVDKSY